MDDDEYKLQLAWASTVESFKALLIQECQSCELFNAIKMCNPCPIEDAFHDPCSASWLWICTINSMSSSNMAGSGSAQWAATRVVVHPNDLDEILKIRSCFSTWVVHCRPHLGQRPIVQTVSGGGCCCCCCRNTGGFVAMPMVSPVLTLLIYFISHSLLRVIPCTGASLFLDQD